MSKILKALDELKIDNDNHWTAEGLPRLETVRFLAGDQSISRDDITKAAPEFSRQNLVNGQTLNAVEKQEPQSSKQAPLQEALLDPAKLTADKLGEAIAKEQEKLTTIKNYLEQARIAYDQQQKVVDDLINAQHSSEANQNPAYTIQSYLQSELKKAEMEAEKRAMLKESSITLDALKELMPKISNLDASFKNK